MRVHLRSVLRRLPRAGTRGRGRRLTIGAAVLVVVMAAVIVPALGIVSGSPGNFESGDGNLVVDGAGHDWANVTSNARYNHLTDVSNSNSDDSFTPGQKQDTVCPDMTGHKNPVKDDFTDIARYTEVSSGASGHTYLYGATIRYAANGSASENIELNKGTNGLCPGSTTLLQRTAGDRLIAIDYTGGTGTGADFHILTWVTSGACFVGNDLPPCWGSNVQTLGSNAAEGKENQSPITAADNPISNQALVAGQFAEFGIDLSAGSDPIVTPGSCSPFAQTIWESRSSGSSFVSSTKDIVLDSVGFSNCGELKVVKTTSPSGADKNFGFTSNLPGTGSTTTCGVVHADHTFCLNAGASTTNSVDLKNLGPNTYTVTENDPAGSGYSFTSLACKNQGGTDVGTISGRQASVALAANDVVTCTYTNTQDTGAIKISKTSAKTGGAALAGAKFSIKDSGGTAISASPVTTAGSGGTVCVDGLALGTYAVQETQAPTGYAIDDTASHNVSVTQGSTCGDGKEATFTATDSPLADLVVTATSEVSGAAKSRVTCVNATPANIGNSPQPSSSTFADPASVTANGLKPGTYTCSVIVDP